MPALLTRTSTRPSEPTISFTAASTAWKFATSVSVATARRFRSVIAAQVASALLLLTSMMPMSAPSAARRNAMALPIPCPPPVTIATCPSRTISLPPTLSKVRPILDDWRRNIFRIGSESGHRDPVRGGRTARRFVVGSGIGLTSVAKDRPGLSPETVRPEDLVVAVTFSDAGLLERARGEINRVLPGVPVDLYVRVLFTRFELSGHPKRE